MTRDPARIDPILADLRRYWHAAPDLRLGQMVMGLLNLSGAPRYGEFNAEDDKVAAYLAAWVAANPPPPDHRDTLPPEIEAAIADAGQALVDAWDSAQSGPPHRFAVYTDPEGDPEVAAGWMAMARMHAAALAAAREAEVARRLAAAPDVEVAIVDYALAAQGDFDTSEERDALRAAIAADKARAAKGLRPVLSQADAERLVGDFNASPYDGSNDCPARAALLAALTGTGEIRRQMDAAAVEMCADRAALTGAGGGR
jgi:hypothetical protein